MTLEIQHESPDVEDNSRTSSYLVMLISEQLFSWHSQPTSTPNILSVGQIRQGERHQCTLMFNSPSTASDCTLNLIMKYTLESDGMTEIRKTLSLDIPVIQPFQTTFDILPRIAKDGGMPDPFSQGDYSLGVSQSWLLMSSIMRLGSEKLELQHLGVDERSVPEDHHLDIQEIDGNSFPIERLPGIIIFLANLMVVLDAVPHTAETVLTLTRANDTDTTVLQLNLVVTWRRQSSSQTFEWNTISMPIPELTFFPFVPRILAGGLISFRHSDRRRRSAYIAFRPQTVYHHLHFRESHTCVVAYRRTFRIQ